ncbi:MAG: Nucleoside triphosphate pyrophosphohydrolase [Chlamydiae bacterium]|nr:Nucleoside triphosphate pyrophosphohydrolase [Chlamydiota bacterium]
MEEFKELIEVAKRLNSPDGCPWDIKQTFRTLRPYILEEAHEVLEAIDKDDDEEMVEELGDLFYTVIFYGMVAEREERFTMAQIIETLREKLIRRHPHVFGELETDSVDVVIKNWDLIKAKEGKKSERKSVLDGIPKALSPLLKGQKVLKKIKKHKAPKRAQSNDQTLAQQVIALIEKANEEGIDLESEVRHELSKEEAHFREWELQSFQD